MVDFVDKNVIVLCNGDINGAANSNVKHSRISGILSLSDNVRFIRINNKLINIDSIISIELKK